MRIWPRRGRAPGKRLRERRWAQPATRYYYLANRDFTAVFAR